MPLSLLLLLVLVLVLSHRGRLLSLRLRALTCLRSVLLRLFLLFVGAG